jgi:hypothetical protein
MEWLALAGTKKQVIATPTRQRWTTRQAIYYSTLGFVFYYFRAIIKHIYLSDLNVLFIMLFRGK